MPIGIEQLLLHAKNAWVARGGRPDAEPLAEMPGWVLRLSGRARIGAWVIFLMFTGMLAATTWISKMIHSRPSARGSPCASRTSESLQ